MTKHSRYAVQNNRESYLRMRRREGLEASVDSIDSYQRKKKYVG